MKQLIIMASAGALALASVNVALADETDYPTRTLMSRHATTTGNPLYTEKEGDKMNPLDNVDASSEFEAIQRMEEFDRSVPIEIETDEVYIE